MYCSAYFNVGVSFQLANHFLLVLRINDCHYRNEIATVGSRGTQLSSAQASLLFCHAAICRGTSITYFFKARCRSTILLPSSASSSEIRYVALTPTLHICIRFSKESVKGESQ
ncbi:hypothetical protein AVEN_166415-1 [Araneus ventricosus]|uniref:Uncharacterized protein n=1 Tax=Araneus ventricosus TaxID=182803 RepID=A0A4Y2X284_ARAVE|nr:hypothetical protein AVEN_42358-1 [Araneus ventricosus]GBO42122.1 hypothetical protein AVEN_166415-1 [Araneus ventricosus]